MAIVQHNGDSVIIHLVRQDRAKQQARYENQYVKLPKPTHDKTQFLKHLNTCPICKSTPTFEIKYNSNNTTGLDIQIKCPNSPHHLYSEKHFETFAKAALDWNHRTTNKELVDSFYDI